MRYGGGVIVALALTAAAFACGFQDDPVSAPQYYRAEGWSLPGATKPNLPAVPELDRSSQPLSLGGALAYSVSPGEFPYITEFPAQEFVLKGLRRRMRAALVKAGIVRWEINGRTVAYSYTLIPVMAHRDNGKWIVDAEAACIYWATFLDDKGDGVFRVLVPAPFVADLIPLWAKGKKI